MTQTLVDLLRHGETTGGACFRGSTDDALSAQGRRQMKSAVADSREWSHIVSSPLCRCLDFAQMLSLEHKLPLTVEPRLQEMHFGDWEGKSADEINRLWPQALTRFYQNPTAYPPGNGEHIDAFRLRIHAAWRDISATCQGERLLIVTHAGVIRILFSLFLNLKIQDCFHIQLNHACLSRFEVFHNDPADFVQLISHRQL